KRMKSLSGKAAGKKCGVLFRDADIEVATWMCLLKMREPGAAWHRRCDRNKLLVCLCKFRERLAENFRIGRRRGRRSFAALDLVFAESVKLVGLLERRRITFAFLGENVQQHRFFLRL